MAKKTGTIGFGVCAIGLLLFIVYAALILLFTGIYTPTAICSIVFALVAFVAAFLTPKLVIKHPDVQAMFFGIPLISFAVYYFFAEIFVSVVFIFFQEHVPFKVALFLQLVLLVAFLIVEIVSLMAQRTSSEQSAARREEAVAWDMQTVDVSTILDESRMRGADAALLNALEHLAETVRYSDAFGHDHPAIREVEARITAKLQDLRAAGSRGDFQSERMLVQELENLYAERSRKLLLIK